MTVPTLSRAGAAAGIVAAVALLLNGCSRSRDRAPSSPALSAPAPRIETIGPAPSSRLQFDPVTPGRIYAGGHVSDDGGRSWSPLADADGAYMELLGGPKAVPITVAAGGRVLCGETILSGAGILPGQGAIAHAAEWRDGSWHVIAGASEERFGELRSRPGRPARQPSSPNEIVSNTLELYVVPLPPDIPVNAVAYLPAGGFMIAMRREIRFDDGRWQHLPGEITSLLAAASGALYATVTDPTGFPLHMAPDSRADWRPVGDVGPARAIAEGPNGTLYVASDRFGRGAPGAWQWINWPLNLQVEHLAAAPNSPLVAGWTRNQLLVSVDGGASLYPIALPALEIEWVAVDPYKALSLLLLDRARIAYRVTFATAPNGASAIAGTPPKL
jgi:hypothetical protein